MSFLARRSLQVVQKRGIAIKNWKRPSMDEYLPPKEPYAQAKAKADAKNNQRLAVGIISLIGAIVIGQITDQLTIGVALTPIELFPYKK